MVVLNVINRSFSDVVHVTLDLDCAVFYVPSNTV